MQHLTEINGNLVVKATHHFVSTHEKRVFFVNSLTMVIIAVLTVKIKTNLTSVV